MRSKVLRTLKAAIAFSLVFSLSVPAFAASEKEQAQQTLAALQQQKAALQNRLADLQANKADTESYIKELDAELETVYAEIDRLAGELEATQAELDKTQAELVKTQEELDVAKAKEAEQYAALKARIKAMYENGDTSMMEIFMKADDISTILNATEYISKISDYDNKLLTDLNETRKEIERIEARLEEQKAQLEEQKARLETLKAEQEAKQEELEIIMEAKQAELDSLNISINEAADDIYNTQAEIDTTNQILAAIAAEEKRQAEEAERQRQLELQRQQELANQQNQQTQDGSGTSDQGTLQITHRPRHRLHHPQVHRPDPAAVAVQALSAFPGPAQAAATYLPVTAGTYITDSRRIL